MAIGLLRNGSGSGGSEKISDLIADIDDLFWSLTRGTKNSNSISLNSSSGSQGIATLLKQIKVKSGDVITLTCNPTSLIYFWFEISTDLSTWTPLVNQDLISVGAKVYTKSLNNYVNQNVYFRVRIQTNDSSTFYATITNMKIGN